jgi:hypothetical protein
MINPLASVASEIQPALLTPVDLEGPVAPKLLGDAANMLDAAGRKPNPLEQQALALHLKKELAVYIGGQTVPSDSLGKNIDELYDNLPTQLTESDLLAHLVSDLLMASRAEQKRRGLFRSIGEQEKERLDRLHKKADEGGRLSITDFETGDEVIFTSMNNTRGRGNEKAEAELRGTVVGFSRFGPGQATALHLLLTEDEKHSHDPPREAGTAIRIVASLNPDNPSVLQQGESLFFVDDQGRASDRVVKSAFSLGIGLDQVNINGVNILQEREWVRYRHGTGIKVRVPKH